MPAGRPDGPSPVHTDAGGAARSISRPGVRGLEMLDRLWGRDRPPVLREEDRDFLAAHCYGGQARRERIRAVTPQDQPVEYDGRLFYGACCRELGTGPMVREASSEYAGYVPSWYRVTLRIPSSWEHVGIVPFRSEGAGWEYPSDPGSEHEGWVSGAELHLAMRYGWTARIHERALLTPGRPLDAWCAALVRVARVEPHATDARAVLVETIGKLASRSEQYFVRPTYNGTDHLYLREGVERVFYDPHHSAWYARVLTPRSAWTEGHLHPELAAQVWSRARVRIARALLRVPAETILEVRGDAITFSVDPGWADDGQVGTLRRKRT